MLISNHTGNFMVELITSVVISVSSLALFGYWFRYSCLLILTAKTAHDHSDRVASTNHLGFPEVRSKLRERPVTDLDNLHRWLERDYRTIAYLLVHSPVSAEESRLECAMLRLHFRAMSFWFRLTQRFLREAATQALEEMSLVVEYLAGSIGERSSIASCGT